MSIQYNYIQTGWTDLHQNVHIIKLLLQRKPQSQALAGLTSLYTHTDTHSFNGHFSGTTQVSRYQKGKTNLDFTGARDSGWQWHQLGHMQVCTSLQTDNHSSTPPLSFLQARMPFLPPNQQRQSTEGINHKPLNWNLTIKWNQYQYSLPNSDTMSNSSDTYSKNSSGPKTDPCGTPKMSVTSQNVILVQASCTCLLNKSKRCAHH